MLFLKLVKDDVKKQNSDNVCSIYCNLYVFILIPVFLTIYFLVLFDFKIFYHVFNRVLRNCFYFDLVAIKPSFYGYFDFL